MMVKNDMSRASAALLIAAMGAGCATVRVARTEPTSIVGRDLSGYCKEGDANEIAGAMIDDCLADAWADRFSDREGRAPVVKLAGVTKHTDDRNVNTWYFGKQLERELLQAGRVRVVADARGTQINFAERDRQVLLASDDSAKTHGNELGPDYTLQTVVNSQNDNDGAGRQVRAYLVNMELVDVETNEKVWIGARRIRKLVRRARTTW